ncbi:hypothetical protein ACFLW0_01330 [Chloroflexota bacterium]
MNSLEDISKRDSEAGAKNVKWWYWALLGLGIAMVAGGLIYAGVTGQFSC